jgi:hypothetical protein
MARRFKGYADEVIGWWATHIINGGCKMCPSETPPALAAEVIAEWERRGKPKPRDVAEKRGTKK